MNKTKVTMLKLTKVPNGTTGLTAGKIYRVGLYDELFTGFHVMVNDFGYQVSFDRTQDDGFEWELC